MLLGVGNVLAEGGALPIFDASLMASIKDGITDQDGNSRRRFRQFLETVSGAGGIFGHLRLLVWRPEYNYDYYNRGGDGIFALASECKKLLEDEFAGRLWDPSQGVQVVVGPHDLGPGVVVGKVGRANSLPDIGDDPLAKVEILHRDDQGRVKDLTPAPDRYFTGQPGHLQVVEKPFAVYACTTSLLLSFREDNGIVTVPDGPIDGMPDRIGIDLRRRIAVLEYSGDEAPQEVALQVEQNGVLEFCVEKEGLPAPGAEPEALIIRITPAAAPQAMAVPTPAADTPASSPQSPAVPPLPADDDEQETIIGGKHAKSSRPGLKVVGFCPPVLPSDCGLLRWTMLIDDDGQILRSTPAGSQGSVTRLAAASGKPGLWLAEAGENRWRQVAPPETVLLAGGKPMALRPVPEAMAGLHHAILPLAQSESRVLRLDGPNILGRAGGTRDGKVSIGILVRPEGLECEDGSAVSLENLGLSRDHAAVSIDGKGAIIVRMLEGKTPVWRLDDNFSLLGHLAPGSSGTLNVNLGDLLVIGSYLLRITNVEASK